MTDNVLISRATLRKVLDVLDGACTKAMLQIALARIPESGEFGGIAQDLDYCRNVFSDALAAPCEPVAWARKDAVVASQDFRFKQIGDFTTPLFAPKEPTP